MSSTAILLVSITIFIIAYVTYGSWLAKKWGVDPSRKTPAHQMEDGVDYVPPERQCCLGITFLRLPAQVRSTVRSKQRFLGGSLCCFGL